MSIDEIASEALRLPAKERALLAGSLWESLEDPATTEGQMNDNEVVALAKERDHQLEAGQVHPVPHDEMMTRLRG